MLLLAVLVSLDPKGTSHMASIQGVYLALFGRPADPLGLAFFNQATNNGANLTAIGDLSASAEYQARLPAIEHPDHHLDLSLAV